MPGTTQVPAAASPPLCAAGETEAQTWPCPCPSTPWTRSGAEGHPCVPPSLQNGAGDTTSRLESRIQPSPIPPGPSQPPLRTPRPRKAPGHRAPPSPRDTRCPLFLPRLPAAKPPRGGCRLPGPGRGGLRGSGGVFWGGAGWDGRAALCRAALSTSRAAAACGRGSAPSLQPPVVKTTRDGAAACKGCKNHPGGGSGHPPSMKTPWAVGHPLAAGSSRVGARRAFLCAPGCCNAAGASRGAGGAQHPLSGVPC